MQKRIIAVAAALVVALAATAAETTADEAKLAVVGWENVKAALDGEVTAAPESVVEYPAKDGKGKFYVVKLAGGGFVVVSGDTELVPVLAYSKDGQWVDDVAQNPLLAMLPIDVAGAMRRVEDNAPYQGGSVRLAASGGGATASVQQQGGNAAKWAKLLAAAKSGGGVRLSAGLLSSVTDLRVPALLKTNWNQSGNGENLYTPNNYVCGCVATAGAQVMFYHKWPRNTEPLTPYTALSGSVGSEGNWTLATDGSGGWRNSSEEEYTPWNPAFGGPYDWDAMASGDSTAKKQAIGRLTRDVGLASKMNYASGGSGAHELFLFRALRSQFGYVAANLIYEAQNGENGPRSWKRAFLSNFDARLPVFLSVPGHAIVADGYGYQDGTLYVHFNLGWGGYCNAWYAPPDLTSALSSFNSISAFVYNINPHGVWNRAIVSGRLLAASGSPIGDGSVVTAKDTSSGDTYSTQTTNGIYALSLPAGTYAIGAEDGAGLAVATNLTVTACVDTQHFSSGAYTPGSGSVANIHGVELQYETIATPVISAVTENGVFYGETLTVAISCSDPGAEIRYTLDGTEPTASSTLYEGPFELSASATVKARVIVGGISGGVVASADYVRGLYWGGKYADTRASRAAHWVEESATTHNATGAWAQGEDFDFDGFMHLHDFCLFEAAAPSKGPKVEIRSKATAEFSCPPQPLGIEDVARAAVRICGENGVNYFQALTRVDGSPAWVDLVGKTPQTGVEYEYKILLNTSSQTWTAWVVDGGVETQLRGAAGSAFEGGVFPYANSISGAVKRLAVTGEATLRSLEGSYAPRKGALILVE